MLRVLIVEDSHATRVCYRYWCHDLFARLGREGLVHEVSSLQAAEQKLRGSADAPYQLALIDISFPVEIKNAHGGTTVELDPSAGLRLCEMMGRKYPHTRIIVSSSTRMDKEVIDFLSHREKCPTVEAFVPEPFTQERFLEIALPLFTRQEDGAEEPGLARDE